MLIYAFRHRVWLVLVIVAADLVISLTVADTLIRWELELLRGAWRGE